MNPSVSYPSRVLRALLLGIPGILVLLVTVSPPMGVPPAMLAVNPAIMLLVSALAGGWAAPRAGLSSTFLLGDRLDARALAFFSLAGIAAGAVVAAVDDWSAPLWSVEGVPSLIDGGNVASLLLGISYGGFTEEIMLRWGLMSVLAVGASFFLPGRGALRLAGLVAALVFAAAHLPAVQMQAGMLDTALVARTMIWNTLLGIVFAIAFIRGGLESAIGAHVGFHLGVAMLAALL